MLCIICGRWVCCIVGMCMVFELVSREKRECRICSWEGGVCVVLMWKVIE